MGFLTRAADTVYTFRFLKLLVTAWEDTPAFEMGIIDKDGFPLRKVRDLTSEERGTYTMFHRLVFKIKRLMNKIPGGKSKIASYAAALYLIKEETGMSEEQLLEAMDSFDFELEFEDINESFIIGQNNELLPGVYTLNKNILLPSSGEELAFAESKVIAHGHEERVGSIFGMNVYKVEHIATKQYINVTSRDLNR
jgi:hypothetical protein|tara:strand:+ start:4969 stop:5553 length:585 start_codon:yes stop_codon:yes gene_type:complete